MNRRTELQSILEKILCSRNVYFQPPESVKMKYPAIVYALNSIDHLYADDLPYKSDKSYRITLIDKSPDSEFTDRIAALPKCRFDRFFTADGLNHYIFTLYF
ncbi:MAG: hypothetical protein NC120_06095 [Ruminococcus sp.]|nr:hypothetical protein [Ruminococcus sp.]